MEPEMTRKAFESIMAGFDDAMAYSRGDQSRARTHRVAVPKQVNAKAVRRKLGMSQTRFAASFGVSLRTLQEWEQGRASPEGPARALLTIIEREPEAVRRALRVR
jgi:putative transcriptional regulator